MKKYFYCLFFLMPVCHELSAQNLAATYYGYDLASTSYKKTRSGKEKMDKKYYTEKVLEIHADSTFLFHYINYHTLNTQGGLEKCCKGKWHVEGDMLILNSRYTAQDFCSARESYIPTNEPGLVKFWRDEITDSTTVTDQWGSRTEDLWYRCVEMSVNGSKIGRYDMDDTMYYKSKGIEKISMGTCEWSSEMDWTYVPLNSLSNCFAFILKRNIGADDMVLDQYKLRISANGLEPLGYGQLQVDDGYDYKKTKPQNTAKLNFGGDGYEDR